MACRRHYSNSDFLLVKEMMDPDYDLFATIVDEGGMAAAGRRLNISPAMVSKRLVRLEERLRSEEHTSELQSLMRISYAVFCLKKKIKQVNMLTTCTGKS